MEGHTQGNDVAQRNSSDPRYYEFHELCNTKGKATIPATSTALASSMQTEPPQTEPYSSRRLLAEATRWCATYIQY